MERSGRRRARVRAGIAWGAGALLGLLASGEGRGQPAADTGVLRQILRSHPEWFQAVLENADRHRLQILYTRIDRDAENRPLFRSLRLPPERRVLLPREHGEAARRRSSPSRS